MSSSATSTTVALSHTNPTPSLRLRQVTRRASDSGATRLSPLQLCKALPSSHNGLDLSSASPAQTLASLRFLVLSYLAELERCLSKLESPDLESWKAKGETKIEEARLWAQTALEMLNGIRADVCSHLPDVHFTTELASVESFLKAHLPELPDMSSLAEHFPELPYIPDMAEMRSHLPDMPHLPDMDDVRAHLPDFTDMRTKFDDVKTCIQEIDLNKHLGYVPTLSTHLQNLHSHLSSMEVEFTKMLGFQSLAPSSLLHEFMDALLSSELVAEITNVKPDMPESDSEEEGMLEHAASEVTKAVRRSLEGMSLITYHDLPHPWKNNPFVTQGYRFIPIERWPLLIKSVFMLHNETLNIHTHLVPFILYLINIISIIRNPTHFDTTEVCFMSFACLCLFASSVWHTMSGCADHSSMVFCARVDYVGIGWLISASVGTVVHYGYQCHPQVGHMFLALCLVTGIMGNIFPFMAWFNMHEYRFHRVGFFLTLAFMGVAPMIGMSMLHSHQEMKEFVAPLLPSFASYLIGLIFYATHWPERHLPDTIRQYLDRVGGNSHAIWHCFIVLAVSQHRQGMQSMKEGLQCIADYSASALAN